MLTLYALALATKKPFFFITNLVNKPESSKFRLKPKLLLIAIIAIGTS